MVQSLEVVREAMEGISGLSITSTYRTPEHNEAVGGSPTSWHLNRSNPAVDVAGPKRAMDELASRLAALPYDAELLYNTKGHYDHVHYAIRSTSINVNRTNTPVADPAEFDTYETPPLSKVDEFVSRLAELPSAATSPPVKSTAMAVPKQSTLAQSVRTAPTEGIVVVGQQPKKTVDQPDLIVRNKVPAADRLRSKPVVGGM